MKSRNRKTWIWVLILAVIVLAGVAATVLISRSSSGVVAVISVDGKVVERIDLTKVRESREIEIESAYGHNTVLVEPGAISVKEADCPDQICVLMGRLTAEGGMPLVCMPHRLIVEIEDDGLDG